MNTSETLKEWTKRVASDLDERGWSALRNREPKLKVDGWWLVDGLGNATERGAALEAFLFEVVSDLDGAEVATLLGVLSHGPTLRRLVAKNLAEAISDDGDLISARWLPLGQEVSRFLWSGRRHP